MKIELTTKILATIVGAFLLMMAVGQFLSLAGFSQALNSYQIFPQFAKFWAVVFLVGETLAGVGLIAGHNNPQWFRGSASLALAVLTGWFVFGLVALSNHAIIKNTGFFGIYFAQGLSVITEVEILILAILALFLAIQGRFFSHRGTMY